MAEPYVGQVSPFAFPFAPSGWAFCNGGTAQINQFTALFSLIGTTFGGNGSSTFGLPNLNGVAPCGIGQGPNLTNRALGQSFGVASVTLDNSTMPPHQHTAYALGGGRGGTGTPSSVPLPTAGLAASTGAVTPYAAGTPNASTSPSAISGNGGGGAHNNRQPFIAVNYCIALTGMYPSFP